VLLIPAVQVAGLWFINPPVTGPMLARRWSGAADASPSRSQNNEQCEHESNAGTNEG
jgi:hypothetical protein